MIDKNKDHDVCCVLRDAGLGSEESPMVAGCSAPSAHSAEQVQGLKSKADPVRSAECGVRDIEDLCSKTGFCRGMEWWSVGVMGARNVMRVACAAWCRMELARNRRGKAPSRQTLPAQSMTVWSNLKQGHDSARRDLDAAGTPKAFWARRFSRVRWTDEHRGLDQSAIAPTGAIWVHVGGAVQGLRCRGGLEVVVHLFPLVSTLYHLVPHFSPEKIFFGGDNRRLARGGGRNQKCA